MKGSMFFQSEMTVDSLPYVHTSGWLHFIFFISIFKLLYVCIIYVQSSNPGCRFKYINYKPRLQ